LGLQYRTQAGLTKVYAKLDGKTYQSSSGVELDNANNNLNVFYAYA
jgi:hypothetical protein